MPHIHTEPGQHDLTVSGYIVRTDGDNIFCLVHMHKKIKKLMQMGGHVELDETPWAAIAHELSEETGYDINQLGLLQPTISAVDITNAVIHPVPVLFNTHIVAKIHYHTDLCYVFVANRLPNKPPVEGESSDLRWYTIDDLESLAKKGAALIDTAQIYRAIIDTYLPRYHIVSTDSFSFVEPTDLSHLD